MSTLIKKILLVFVIAFCIGGNNVFASDNVLQAVQIDGVNDSYNIILKSDDVAEVRKTVQAPNKMVLLLKGIRASKTINTIYNNTTSVDSVVVEPQGEDTVKILIQAANVSSAKVQFDSLKTPLGVLGNSGAQNKPANAITLSEPMTSFRPVYNENNAEDEASFSLDNTTKSLIPYAKKLLGDEKLGWLVTFGLFTILLLNGIKLIKGKDNEIRIGLSQSLQDREVDLYRGLGVANMSIANPTAATAGQQINQQMTSQNSSQRNISSANYGLKSYQNGTRSPYATPEVQRPRPIASPVTPTAPISAPRQAVKTMAGNTQTSQQIKNLAQSPIQKSSNIDSMKFLESMTKIYEKNGRSDLAQGLKSNMKKAKMNSAI